MMSEIVERVAKVLDAELKQHWLDKSGVNLDALARAAIAAMREPTEAMQAAGINHPRMKEVGDVLVFAATRGVQIRDEEPWPLQAAYAAMIDAALAD